IGESLIKHTAELRGHERRLFAAVRGADNIASLINLYARDAKDAGIVMDDALRTGATAQADADAMARVKALRDPVAEAAKDVAKPATEAADLARKAHTLAEMGPGYSAQDAESQASTEDEAQ